MANAPKGPEDYVPFRFHEQSYLSRPRPPYAYLAYAAGQAISEVMVTDALLDSRGRRLKTAPMTVTTKHNPKAARAYSVDGLTSRHPMSARPRDEFWGFPLPAFEHAWLVEPEDLAVACADALRGVLSGTPLWDPKRGVFLSSATDITYSSLAIEVAEEGAIQPERPFTTHAFAEYAARVGDRALTLATGAEATGGVKMFPHTYLFLPKAEELGLH